MYKKLNSKTRETYIFSFFRAKIVCKMMMVLKIVYFYKPGKIYFSAKVFWVFSH